MKRFLSVILAVCLLQTTAVFAEDSISTEAVETNAVVTMTADEAVAYALEHSPALAAARAAVVSKQYSKYQAWNVYDQYKKMLGFSQGTITLDDNLVATGYAYHAAEKQLEMAERSLETEKYSLDVDVRNSFYSYINTKNKTALAETNLTSTKEKCTFAKARLDGGTITKNEYANFELSVFAAENALSKAKRNEEMALRELKDILNFPIEQELKAVGEFSASEPFYEIPQNAVKLSRTQNTYLNLEDAYKLAGERWSHAEGFYFPSEHAYKIEKATYETAAADFEKNVRNIDSQIYKVYNGLLTAKENIEYLKKSIELLEVDTEAAYLRYEMGVVTANSYFDIEQKLFSMKNDLIDAQLSYYNGIQNYKKLYTLEKPEVK